MTTLSLITFGDIIKQCGSDGLSIAHMKSVVNEYKAVVYVYINIWVIHFI